MAGAVALHTTAHSPAGLWQFQNGLTDSSGNGLTLSLVAGTERYTDIFPGIRALFLDVGLLVGRSAFTASLNILGDLTLEYLFYTITNNINTPIISHGAAGETEATNFSYSMLFTATPTLQSLHEFSTGTNAILNTNNLPPHRLSHLAMTRASNVVQFYLNGKTFGAASGTFSAPTGSTSGRFRVGPSEGINASLGAPNMIASVKVIASALTASQIKAEYNLTLGSFYGFVN